MTLHVRVVSPTDLTELLADTLIADSGVHSGSRRHRPVERVRQLDRGPGLCAAVAAERRGAHRDRRTGPAHPADHVASPVPSRATGSSITAGGEWAVGRSQRMIGHHRAGGKRTRLPRGRGQGAVEDPVGVGVGVGEGDKVAEGVAEGVGVGEVDGEVLGLVVGLVVGVALADGEVEGERVGVALWVGAELPWAGPTRFGVWTAGWLVNSRAMAAMAMPRTATAPPVATPAANERRSRRYSVDRRSRSQAGSAARRAAQLLTGAAAMPSVGNSSRPASSGPLSWFVLVRAPAMPRKPNSASVDSAQLARSASHHFVRSLVFGVRRNAALRGEQARAPTRARPPPRWTAR